MNIKTLLFSMLALITCLLSGCNEDATKDDSMLSQEILGSWTLSFQSDNTSNSMHYTFKDKTFTYATYATKMDDPTIKSLTINGTWRIYKGVLELTYDLQSLSTDGYDAQETKNIYDGFYNENLLVNDMMNSSSPYGKTVTFSQSGNVQTMRLSSISGSFVRTSY